MKCHSSNSLRCFTRLSDIAKATKNSLQIKIQKPKVLSTMKIKKEKIKKQAVLFSKKAPAINCDFPYRRDVNLSSYEPICTTQRFLKDHSTIALQLSGEIPMHKLTAIKNKLINQWKAPKPDYIPLRTRVLRIIEKLKQLQISINDLQLGLVFSSKPFEKKGSKQFIEACKNGDLIMVKCTLLVNRYLVYDFD